MELIESSGLDYVYFIRDNICNRYYYYDDVILIPLRVVFSLAISTSPSTKMSTQFKTIYLQYKYTSFIVIYY